jgi:hypothetical protein
VAQWEDDGLKADRSPWRAPDGLAATVALSSGRYGRKGIKSLVLPNWKPFGKPYVSANTQNALRARGAGAVADGAGQIAKGSYSVTAR